MIVTRDEWSRPEARLTSWHSAKNRFQNQRREDWWSERWDLFWYSRNSEQIPRPQETSKQTFVFWDINPICVVICHQFIRAWLNLQEYSGEAKIPLKLSRCFDLAITELFPLTCYCQCAINPSSDLAHKLPNFSLHPWCEPNFAKPASVAAAAGAGDAWVGLDFAASVDQWEGWI